VLWALDQVIENKTVGKVNLFMGAKTVGTEILVGGASVDRICPTVVVEPDHVLFFDIFNRARIDPVWHRSTPSRFTEVFPFEFASASRMASVIVYCIRSHHDFIMND
jgi:hypothetical protein